MNLYHPRPFRPRGRRDFHWDIQFCVRQKDKYNPEDSKVLENPATTAQVVEAFCDEQESILNPPCYNYVALKEFLDQADVQHLATSRPVLALLDDRREQSGNEAMRHWESDKYARQPLPGENVERLTFDEGGLFRKLKENVLRLELERLLLCLLTPRREQP
jgi:hypothetical protein